MKRRLTLCGGGLALALGAVALTLYARPGAPGRGKGEEATKIAASRVTHVTVYPDSALVTREVEVPAGAGLLELVVSPLPEATINSSLYSENADGIRVLTTRFRTRPVKEDTREEVRKLEDEAKKLQAAAQKIQADARAIDGNLVFLNKLEGYATASTTHATEKGKLDSDAAIALAKYVMEGRAEKTKEQVALQQLFQENAEQQRFVARKLAELTAGTTKTERDAILVVDKANAAAGKVRLNYLVGSASWKPQYKFRAGQTAKDAVAVEYLAAVMQQTGEDWRQVQLVLSTAQPMLNAAPPELGTLAVAVVPRGTPMAGARVQDDFRSATLKAPIANPAGANTLMELDRAVRKARVQSQEEANKKETVRAKELANYAAALEQARDLVVQTEGKQRLAVPNAGPAAHKEGPSVTYHLGGRLSVPSRADDQVIEVAKLEMEPDYFYKAVPVLSAHVYRQAELLNRSKMVLLPGEATMYHGSDFVGRMNLPLVAVGERFTVGFGAEPQLQVQRQMVEKSRAMQGGNQILRFEYRILVSSYKGEKVRVQVWDRLPHAQSEAMGVSLVKASPEVCKDPVYLREERPTNLLRWDLEVGAGSKGEKAAKIQYEFKLELDKQATIGSFISK